MAMTKTEKAFVINLCHHVMGVEQIDPSNFTTEQLDDLFTNATSEVDHTHWVKNPREEFFKFLSDGGMDEKKVDWLRRALRVTVVGNKWKIYFPMATYKNPKFNKGCKTALMEIKGICYEKKHFVEWRTSQPPLIAMKPMGKRTK